MERLQNNLAKGRRKVAGGAQCLVRETAVVCIRLAGVVRA